MTFSERLEFLLETKKLNVEDLSEELGSSQSLVEGWLDGTIVPSKGELVKLALTLNVKSTYLVGSDRDLLFNDKSHQEKTDFENSEFKKS